MKVALGERPYRVSIPSPTIVETASNTYDGEYSMRIGVTRPITTDWTVNSYSQLDRLQKLTIIEPIGSCGQSNSFTSHRKREDLTRKNPADRSVAQSVRRCEQVYTSSSIRNQRLHLCIRSSSPPTYPAEVHAATVCAGQSSSYSRT